MKLTDFKCPLCGNPMESGNDATGVVVICRKPYPECPSHEDVFGHGKNEKEAYEIACQKYQLNAKKRYEN